MEETTFIKPEWHIYESEKGTKVYSKGFRCYGTFDCIETAYNFIVNGFPHKRGEIHVHQDNGIVKAVLYFPCQEISSQTL